MRTPSSRQRSYQPWTREELDTLAAVWPNGAMKAALAALPGRGEHSIRGKVSALNLAYTVYESVPQSDFVDAAIKRAYAKGRPNLAELAKTTGRNKGWLKGRAGVLGVRAMPTGTPKVCWSPEEDAILESGLNRHLSVSTIHRQLNRAGHSRSLTAIVCRSDNLGLRFSREGWSATQVAVIFDMDSHAVLRWIDLGWLRATRQQGPGSVLNVTELQRVMYSVKPDDVRRFMLAHPEKWDHRRMKKEVLLDLLCPDRFNTAAMKDAA